MLKSIEPPIEQLIRKLLLDLVLMKSRLVLVLFLHALLLLLLLSPVQLQLLLLYICSNPAVCKQNID